MSDREHAPTDVQFLALAGISREFGMMRWRMIDGDIIATDRDGDEWQVGPNGETRCAGGGTVTSEPEPEEEES